MHKTAASGKRYKLWLMDLFNILRRRRNLIEVATCQINLSGNHLFIFILNLRFIDINKY